MLIVSHEMAFVREVASRVVMMDKGMVVEEGPPIQIFDSHPHRPRREFVGKILKTLTPIRRGAAAPKSRKYRRGAFAP